MKLIKILENTKVVWYIGGVSSGLKKRPSFCHLALEPCNSLMLQVGKIFLLLKCWVISGLHSNKQATGLKRWRRNFSIVTEREMPKKSPAPGTSNLVVLLYWWSLRMVWSLMAWTTRLPPRYSSVKKNLNFPPPDFSSAIRHFKTGTLFEPTLSPPGKYQYFMSFSFQKIRQFVLFL